jgi:IS605 OrfB family transposase
VAKIHQRTKNQRKHYCYKEAKKIVDQYQYNSIEELNIKSMIEGSHVVKSIMDGSWNQFFQFITYKVAKTGRKLWLVNPAYTRQIYSQSSAKYFGPRIGWPGSNP